ncbi:MAG: DUF3418 domain-containing protein [Verrucomicrobia bacterium]|nr:DUF3418 domain-containing protein [Verrucomicrobiota bacterium]
MPPSLPEGRRGMGRGGAVSSKDSASPLDLKRDPSPQPSPIGGERERSVGGSASTALDLPQYAWPGLQFEDGNVNLRLFHSPDAAREASLPGVRRLVELAIQKDLGWLEKDLRGLSRFEAHYAPIGTGEELRETALEHLRRHLLPTSPLPALTEAHFKLAVDAARRRVPGLALQLVDRVGAILELYQQAFKRIGPVGPSYALRSEDAEVNVGQASSLPFHGTSSLRNSGGGMPPEQADRMSALRFRASSKTLSGLSQLQSKVPAARSHPLAGELAALLPPRFLERISFERLPHFPRYLKALLIRAERAALNPLKDQERSRQLVPYLEALKTLEAQEARSAQSRQLVEEFRWMIEEFKVSLFAQELGTAVTVSPKRLNEQLDRIASSP